MCDFQEKLSVGINNELHGRKGNKPNKSNTRLKFFKNEHYWDIAQKSIEYFLGSIYQVAYNCGIYIYKWHLKI